MTCSRPSVDIRDERNAHALNFLGGLIREEPVEHEREAIESSDELVGRIRFLVFSDKVLASGGMRAARFSRKHICISKCNFFGNLGDLKKIIVPVLRRYGVRRAAVFGSFARGEAREDSDLDIIVEFEEGRSLLDLAGLKVELEDVLGRRVDIVTYGSLHPLLRERVLKEEKRIL